MKKFEAVGVKFRDAGKVYDYLPKNIDCVINEKVVIEADKGEDIGIVMVLKREIEVEDNQEMKSLIRKATAEDIEKDENNKKDVPKAFKECRTLLKEAKLDMKLITCEFSLDRSKLTYFFTAEGRVDFRQLVKDLARIFKTRIEMRQIGVRDATKMLGGFGLCGREFCCASFLHKFDNISIKMAKKQNLILNPIKISGVCGRLMCCLVFEKDGYNAEHLYVDKDKVADEVIDDFVIVDKD